MTSLLSISNTTLTRQVRDIYGSDSKFQYFEMLALKRNYFLVASNDSDGGSFFISS